VKSLFEASAKKAQNRPSTQLIEATSFVERWNATIKAKELTCQNVQPIGQGQGQQLKAGS
jgi:hypothetical protein